MADKSSFSDRDRAALLDTGELLLRIAENYVKGISPTRGEIAGLAAAGGIIMLMLSGDCDCVNCKRHRASFN
jgi:hypothetical protein